jgi:hypothetical protein
MTQNIKEREKPLRELFDRFHRYIRQDDWEYEEGRIIRAIVERNRPEVATYLRRTAQIPEGVRLALADAWEKPKRSRRGAPGKLWDLFARDQLIIEEAAELINQRTMAGDPKGERSKKAIATELQKRMKARGQNLAYDSILTILKRGRSKRGT